MELTCHLIYNLPIVVIDNYHSQSACNKIWQELCFLNNSQEKFLGPKQTGSALDIDTGITLKQNMGISLDNLYADPTISNILQENKKLFSNDLFTQLQKHHVFFRYLRGSPSCSTLLQYYEDGDHYKTHTDGATLTAICYFYKIPKSFSGGDLIIEDKLQVECGYNRMIILPSILFHSVKSIKVDQALLGQNFGRYSITQFIGSPMGDMQIN